MTNLIVDHLVNRVEAGGPYYNDGPVLLEALRLAIRHGDMPASKLKFFIKHGYEVFMDKKHERDHAED